MYLEWGTTINIEPIGQMAIILFQSDSMLSEGKASCFFGRDAMLGSYGTRYKMAIYWLHP